MDAAKTTITITRKTASEDWVEFSFSAAFQSDSPAFEAEECESEALTALFQSIYKAVQGACIDRLQQQLDAARRSIDGLASDCPPPG